MLRYFAMIWDPASSQLATVQSLATRIEHASVSLHRVYSNDGLIVFVAGTDSGSSEIYNLPGGTGVIVGKLFQAKTSVDNTYLAANLQDHDSNAIRLSCGRHLIENYWGRYVAFLHNVARNTVHVLRDPVGSLACFRTQHHGVQICFSNISDCLAAGVTRFNVNWQYVGALLIDNALQIRETGLNEVYENLPGECVEFNGAATTKSAQYWDPTVIAQTAVIEDLGAAVTAVRRTTQGCVRAWASCYGRILHHLSGGLDSAVVLAALQGGTNLPQITCVNYFDDSAEGDERDFAKSAASAADCDLLQLEREVTRPDLEAMLRMPRTVHPEGYIYRVGQGIIDSALARQANAAAIFGGVGGDQLFYHDEQILAAADCMCFGGLRHTLRTVLDVAKLEGYSALHVLRTALQIRFAPRARQSLPTPADYVRFASPDLVTQLRQEVAEPRTGAMKVAPGKHFQIESLNRAPLSFDPLASDNGHELVSPLLSQPLIELCLRIPTYLHVSGGRDRSIARQAFASELPAAILTRRSKGGMTHFSVKVLRSNRAFFRDLLLDGELSRANLIDVGGLSEFLSSDFDAFSNGVTEILYTLMRIEVWLRSWTLPMRQTTPVQLRSTAEG